MNSEWLPAIVGQAFHNEHSLKVAFGKGQISLDKAAEIANKKRRTITAAENSPRITT